MLFSLLKMGKDKRIKGEKLTCRAQSIEKMLNRMNEKMAQVITESHRIISSFRDATDAVILFVGAR